MEHQQKTAAVLVEHLISIARKEHGLNPNIQEPLRRAWVDLAIRHFAEADEAKMKRLAAGPPEELFAQVAELLLYGLAGPGAPPGWRRNSFC